MITLYIDNLRELLAPLHYRYPRQIVPQPAYVEINEDGEVSANWRPEIGNSTSFAVFHRRTIRFGVSPAVNGAALAALLESTETLTVLSRLHDGHSIEWDGANLVGHLTQDAEVAILEMETLLQELEQVEIQTAETWIENDSLEGAWPEGETLQEAAANLESGANREGIALDGDMEAALLAKAEAEGIQGLLDSGRMDIVRSLPQRPESVNWSDEDHEAVARAILLDLDWLPRDAAETLADMIHNWDKIQ